MDLIPGKLYKFIGNNEFIIHSVVQHHTKILSKNDALIYLGNALDFKLKHYDRNRWFTQHAIIFLHENKFYSKNIQTIGNNDLEIL